MYELLTKKRLIGFLACLSIGFSTLCLLPSYSLAETDPTPSASNNESAEATPAIRPKYDPKSPEILQDLFLYAENAVLIEQHTGKILYDMKSGDRIQPASTTKIITLLIALEHGNLSDTITVGDEINRIPYDSSKVPLLMGETLTLEDLLYGLIIKSGNDAAVTIAKHIAGSQDAFVNMMNKKATELGCKDTNFNNPHGYEDKKHYTTSLDMAIIARACMTNAEFRKIVSTRSFIIKANNVREEDTTIYTKNQFIGRSSSMEYQYEYGTGIKTGYFSAAKHTFVASASKNGVDLIAVVMKSTQAGKWIDAARLMEYGFATHFPYSIQDIYQLAPIEIEIEGAVLDDVAGGMLKIEFDPKSEALTLAETEKNIKKVKSNFASYYKFEPLPDIQAPIVQGQHIGTLIYTPPNGESLKYKMVASRAVDAPTVAAASFSSLFGDRTDSQSNNLVIALLIVSSILAACLITFIILIFMRKRRRNAAIKAYKDSMNFPNG